MGSMVLVQGGRFVMGNDQSTSEAEKPAHPVTIDSFYMSKFELTQDIFTEVMGPSYTYFPGDNNPMNNVSWQQVQFFIAELNKRTHLKFRLPTEAEWEFAAQGGNQSKGYKYSGSNNIDQVAWYAGNANNKLHPVGQKKPNELGLYDMTGNVGELVSDAYDKDFYFISPSNNPNNNIDTDRNLAHKSLRGGGYSYDANESENYRRDFASQSTILVDIGLRLAIDTK
ncbi:formylglycine-generating enzyme family protein [Vibrio sp. SS-MA-C1-2]|nr:SUMF1/EgtB/PvdO family nonheme iron enzyme [Vibrio sp. SS-MA-C1-2]UJF20154.1 formylglycine-generating enzyme family protein [Vibrio sp. SS-MA-C1-2]